MQEKRPGSSWEALCGTMAGNRRILELFSAYLRTDPAFVQEGSLLRLQKQTLVDAPTAFCALVSAYSDLDAYGADRDFYREYLLPSVTQLDPAVYRADPYYQNIRIVCQQLGSWKLQQEYYAPYEAFVWRDPVCLPDGREIPQIGFFSQTFSFPSVSEGGRQWMSVTPNEIETMKAPLALARGRVVTFGLGLGYFAYMASCKPEVEEVTVVERDRQVIDLFTRHILPQFSHPEKILLRQEDAFAFAGSAQMKGFDLVFCDLWHDVSDGLEMYLRLKRLEKQAGSKSPWQYWIEPSLLCQLRRMVFDQLCAALEGPGASALKDEGAQRWAHYLSDSFLRELAGDIRPVSPGQ